MCFFFFEVKTIYINIVVFATKLLSHTYRWTNRYSIALLCQKEEERKHHTLFLTIIFSENDS